LEKKRDYNKRLGLKYYRKNQYVKAVSFLEKALRQKKDDPELYLFLGYASLYSNDVEGARRYFRGGLLVKEDDQELLKGLAYLYLKDERIEDAISLWGEVLEKNPHEKVVKRALEKLRSSEDVRIFIKSMKPDDYLSAKIPLSIKIKPYLLGLSVTAGLVILAVLFYVTPLYQKALQRFYPEIVALQQVSLPADTAVIQDDGSEALYSFTGEEIKASFTRIKRYIYRKKTNTAIISLNKIMLSNASPLVKERFKILYTFIDPPDPLSVDYIPRLYEIMKEPAAYKGVYILWTGKIANLDKKGDKISFDLLVNYENEDTIEGIAHVSISGTYYIENKQNVEVFGTYSGYDTGKGKLMINGIMLKDLGL